MNETLEQTIKRLEFCCDCIVCDSEPQQMEYDRLDGIISELKEKLKKQTI